LSFTKDVATRAITTTTIVVRIEDPIAVNLFTMHGHLKLATTKKTNNYYSVVVDFDSQLFDEQMCVVIVGIEFSYLNTKEFV
jgi:hypothetical protein